MLFSSCFLLPVDLTESSIPRWMFESGAVFLHGYDKEGNKLCRWSPSHVKTSSMCVLIAIVHAHNSAHLVETCLDCSNIDFYPNFLCSVYLILFLRLKKNILNQSEKKYINRSTF